MRGIRLSGVVLAVVVACGAVFGADAAERHVSNKVVGAGGCTASGCHGLGINEIQVDSVVQGNEFQIWSQTDGHAQSYLALSTDKARRIARNMGVGSPQSADLCLTCHAVAVPAELQGPSYNVAEGVNCEGCHGPAGQWIDTHFEVATVPVETLRAQGMYPTEDPAARADMCLDCHLGTVDTFAGHQLLAAGHPRTGFELASDTRLTAHYTIDADYIERKPVPPESVQWAIGQAVSVQRRMDLLISPRSGVIGPFPQLAFFECHSCHQPMSVKRRASVNRRGQPKLHDANMRMMEIALGALQPGLSDQVDRQRRALHTSTTRSRDALVQAASAMRTTARDAQAVMAAPGFATADLDALLRTFVAAGASGDYADFASAEQLMKAVDWTIFALREEGLVSEERFRDLYALQTPVFETVETDDGYDAAAYQRAMRSFLQGISPTN